MICFNFYFDKQSVEDILREIVTTSSGADTHIYINYLNRGAQGIDIVALGIDFVAVRAWAQSVCRLE